MKQGWIKLHRSIQESRIWTGPEPFDMRSAWVDLLMMANHKDNQIIFDKKVITVGQGQILTSMRKLSARWHWGINRVRHYLGILVELEMVTLDVTPKRTLLTIENYGKYQNCETLTDTPTDTVTEHSQIHSQIHRQITNKNEEECIKNDKESIHSYLHGKAPIVATDERTFDYDYEYKPKLIGEPIIATDERYRGMSNETLEWLRQKGANI